MEEKELKQRYAEAVKRFKLRCARLLFFYHNDDTLDLFAEEGLRLVKEAGLNVRKYAVPYEEFKKRIPEFQGMEIIKDVFEKEEMEETQRKIEEEWKAYENELLEKFPDNSNVVKDIIETVKHRTILLTDHEHKGPGEAGE